MLGLDNLKIIDAHQAQMINNFKNAKQKLLKTDAVVCFNKICRINQLTPKYDLLQTVEYCK
jgi:hypothetical protein